MSWVMRTIALRPGVRLVDYETMAGGLRRPQPGNARSGTLFISRVSLPSAHLDHRQQTLSLGLLGIRILLLGSDISRTLVHR